MNSIGGVHVGTFGIWTMDFEWESAAEVRASVEELETLGWSAVWIPETYGHEALTYAGYLLSCTEHLHVVNGIAKIGTRDPRATRGAAALLADAYPGRHVLGLGVGGSTRGTRPFTAMNDYLDALDTFATKTPSVGPQLRILGGHGPKMLELARDRSAGAHTYKVTAAHTRQSRAILGPDAFLGVEQAVLFESDPQRARAIARAHLRRYLDSPFNVAKFRRLGYGESEIGNNGSDRLVDDLVYWGDVDSVVDRLRDHLDAGADHVCIQVIGDEPGVSAMPSWRVLAASLL